MISPYCIARNRDVTSPLINNLDQ